MHRLVALLALTVGLVACTPAVPPPTSGATTMSPPVSPPAAAAPRAAAPPPTSTSTALAVIPYAHPLRVTGTYPTHCLVRVIGSHRLPDRACTPGALGELVTQASIATTICRSGWTTTVRPPQAATDPVKTAAMAAYGMAPSARSTTELDHEVPLELGGADDVANLWPQPSDIPGAGFRNTKDSVETALKNAVCAHRVTLAAAQRAIAVNWTTARAVLGV